MSAELLIANLLRVAKDDLEGARLLSSQANRNAICLCAQSAEKIIRAVLTSEGKHGGIKHDLRAMVDLIPQENPLKPALRAVEQLSAYATSYRYPTAAGRILAPPSLETFNENCAKVESALREAVVRFKVDFSKPDSPAGSGAPIR